MPRQCDIPEEVEAIEEFIRKCGFAASTFSFGNHSWRIRVSKNRTYFSDVMLGDGDGWAISVSSSFTGESNRPVMGHLSDPKCLNKIKNVLDECVVKMDI